MMQCLSLRLATGSESTGTANAHKVEPDAASLTTALVALLILSQSQPDSGSEATATANAQKVAAAAAVAPSIAGSAFGQAQPTWCSVVADGEVLGTGP